MDDIKWFQGDNGVHYARNTSVNPTRNLAVLWYDIVSNKALLHWNGTREEYASVEAAKVAFEFAYDSIPPYRYNGEYGF